ncbi:MAG: VWA domain-containing protein [Parachlamydiaceae bacterium]|nr:VWA domain-containing protein [Parachlamydiaceae bacterium]
MNDFHFLRPALFWFLIPLLGLLWLMVRSKRSESIWNKICSKELLPYILAGKTKQRDRSYLLIALTLSLLTFALAGPVWEMLPQMLFKSKSGLVIALDLSPSMDAGDIKPSRLKRALYKINDFLGLHKDGQTALIVFSEDPYIVTPLTDDLETIKALLPALDTSIMPAKGHRVSKAISKASDLLSQAGISGGSILLVTSELSNEEMDKALKEVVLKEVTVSILGVGTDESVPIPKPSGGFMTNSKGAMILTKLANENLNYLAKSSHGKYVKISVDDSDIQAISDHLVNAHQLHSQEEIQSPQTQWHDHGYLFVLLALPFASLLFRRGVVVIAMFIIPQTLQALSWNSLWYTSDQQAEQLFHQESYQEAKEKFQDPAWLAATNYKLEDYETSANLLEHDATPEGLYNYGTAKAKQGDLEAALKAYNEVLEKQPDHEDALYNKNLIEDFQKQQNDQNKQNKDNKDNKENKDQKKDQNEKQKPDQNQEGQSQDQKDDEPQNEDSSGQNDSKNQQPKDKKGQDLEKRNSEEESSSSSDKEQKEQEKGSEQQKSSAKSQRDSQDHRDKSRTQNSGTEEKETPTEELQKQYRDQVDKKIEKQEQPPEKREVPAQEVSVQEEMTPEEQQRKIDEQWLQRIPDDPGGLLRRKFLYQYKKGGTAP